MLDMITQWYRRRFTDPQVIVLSVILLVGFGVIYFFNGILAPVLAAIVLAYLLEWPTVQLEKLGCSRALSVSIVLTVFMGISSLVILIVAPTVWQQGLNLFSDLPNMLNRFNVYAHTLPARYPALVDAGIIDMIADNLRSKISLAGESVFQFSVASLIGLLTLAIYLILVPLMVFFLLKDKNQMVAALQRVLPRNHGLAGKLWNEMNQQITNYIRGKVTEMIILTVCTYIVFAFFGLNYSLLLAVLVGLSVLIPYIGTVIVTIPVIIVALFQWGLGADFWTLFIAYLVVQGLDGNLLVPILFSEAVNLHPLVIILSVIIFGGLWGFWGVFFAIPLATLIKAVIHVWPEDKIEGEKL
ncbi:AI-2E family transporter [Xenorhabdus nematophila]|uniref:AI-2E family transporter n=1 Tax=Xenorhabdus nematophila TaxID=628 RepID=UPI000542C854|nr:AI-2E family transporter [Xenorhabdus nematophila]CEF29310.1 putative permease (PerM family) [Xenorhabdus nematophila str. Websteri]AYA39987.1 AI-2E family transporter [Xenorhabdus nematophila]KHD28218.1 permase [Xenorhabdus nematophila]MBA0018625.1 AI-2E family transporter [Xenorhabdus nematophila]MCB4425754.1 AI-2E family transporter [Xenorhabdus nematophila]